MRSRPSLPLIACIVVAPSLACSSSSYDSSSTGDGGDAANTSVSGLDGRKLVTSLSDDEAKKLCDWSATLYGGYGKSIAGTCEGGTVTNPGPINQSVCVAGIKDLPLGCPVTVAQTEACLGAQSKADPCDVAKLPPECSVYSDAHCRRTSDAGTDSDSSSAD
jgi:hypothetical protein